MSEFKYDAVLFDLDGTVLDTIPLIVESFQHTFMQHLGKQENDKDIIATIGLPLDHVFLEYGPEMGRKLLDTYIAHNNARLSSNIGMFLDMYQLFESLEQAGLKMGIVTSKRSEATKASLKLFELEKFFSVVIAREATKKHKPHPQPLYKAMEELKIGDPQKVVYVGDSIHDLQCARNANIAAVIVDWTLMDKEELHAAKPDLWLNSALDLYDWLVK